MNYLIEGIVYCDCGVSFILPEQARRLNKERYDVLTVPFFTIKRGANRELGTADRKIRQPATKQKIS